ncbi:MAG: hypothetical protein GVY36_02045 [Verrucomicrobia bacterium]|jgi:hypothetical protein|nr:hypothetical protein [Verrucomicrobiota bacterium]
MNEDSSLKNIDWSKTTFEGAERENLRGWQKLSFDEKLQANEEMNELANDLFARRKANGLPYIDPDTGELVSGKVNASATKADS